MAEISHYRDALTFFDLDEVWESVAAEMAENEDYMPFIPSERNDTACSAILGEIHILPEDTIQPVTRDDNHVFAIDANIADLRSEFFTQAPYRARLAIYTDYISLKKQALEDGNSAITALSAQLSITGSRATLAQNGAR